MQAEPLMEEQTKDLADIIDAVRRRRAAIGLIAGTLFFISLLIAALLPSVYRSSATILIEEQDIPSDMVKSAVNTFAVQRIQTISQRVMTRSNLMDVINKYNLYASDKRTKTEEEIVDGMRKDIKLETINADVVDPRNGVPTKATIAFTLSYDGESPGVTQKVANELTTLFLNENIKSRTQQAEDTYAFMKDEADRLSKQISDYESKLATFKAKNSGNLPEDQPINKQFMDRAQSDIYDVGSQIRNAEERKFYLQAQLAQISPSGPSVNSSGQLIPDRISRLKALRAQYATDLSRYSPDHPDVQRERREIAALEGGDSGDSKLAADEAKQLADLRAQLAVAKKKYNADHPDVIRLRKQIAEMERQLSKPAHPEAAVSSQFPDNPAYLTLQAQLQAADSDIKSLRAKRDQLTAKLTDYETRMAHAPAVESEYATLSRGLENALAKFRDIKAKQMEADLSKQMEKESKGERFSLIDPPAYPEKPVSPNRPVLLLLGCVLSLGSGVGYAVLADSMDKSIRGSKGIVGVLRVNPLGIIPYIENSEDIARKRRNKRRWWIFSVSAVVIVLLLINFLWMPLDVLGLKAMRIISARFGE